MDTKLHQLTPEETLKALHSVSAGLTADEALRRQAEFGPNQVPRARQRPIVFRLAKEFLNFFAVMLWIAAGLAFAADAYQPGQGMGILGLAIVAVILINGLFSFWQVQRAQRALSALEKLLPQQVRVLRDAAFSQIPSEQLVPGDVVALEAGDIIPADCRLIEAFGVLVDNATVTGESVPVARDEKASGEEDFLHSRNVLLAGTVLAAGQARAVVFATGLHTEFGKIAHLTQTAGETTFPLQREIMFVSRVVAVLATGMGFVFFAIGQAMGLGAFASLLFGIGIIVANVPEGLLPELTLSLAMGAQRMARRNVLIRHLPAVETLGSVTVICTDKTGTLTENRMTARKVFLGGQFRSLNDIDPAAETTEPYRKFFEAALFCHDLKTVDDNNGKRMVGDPTEIALVAMAQEALPGVQISPHVDEIPFDSERRRVSTVHAFKDGMVLYTKGALETVLPLCLSVLASDGVEPITDSWRQHFLRVQDAMGETGLRVLSMAYRDVGSGYRRNDLEHSLTLAGLVGLEDPPRPEVAPAIAKCREAGIRVIPVTGDHPQTAIAVARRIGLFQSDHPVVITGDQFERMSKTQLQLALDASEILFARVRADHKMRIVAALQAKGQTVAVTGDGVNDAPALKQAEIGIAMGRTGTDVAREASDMILVDDNFAGIVAGIEEGRTVFDNVRKFLTYVLVSNIPEIVPYVAFVLFRIPLALTVLQMLAVDLGTDILPALALGAESPEPDVMKHPPRSRKNRLLSWPLLARSYLFLGAMEAAAAMSAFFFVLGTGGWRQGQEVPADLYNRGTTACFVAIVVMQIVNVFLCRSNRRSLFSFGLLSNRLILVGIGIELVLVGLIVFSPWGNLIFRTTPISWSTWTLMLPFGVAMLALEEGRKWLVVKLRSRNNNGLV